MAELPPPPGYAVEPIRAGDIEHPPVEVRAVPYEEADGFAKVCKARLREMRDAGTLSAAHARFESAYLANLGVYNFYGATFYLGHDGARPTGLVVARPGTAPRKNAWGRYVNHYLAYTAPGFRRQGYATAAEKIVRQMWADDGMDRVKTLCQSWLGFAYHEHLRDRIWGVKPGTGELAIDSPLHGGPWPPGVPIKARQFAAGREMTELEIIRHLTDPDGRFRRTQEEVTAVLGKRAYRR